MSCFNNLRGWVFLAALAACAPTPVFCAEGVPGQKSDGGNLDNQVRTALGEAVGFFMKRAEAGEGWVVPPKSTRRIVGVKTEMLRYREVVVEVPKYTYEYETFEVTEKVRVGQSSDAVDTYRKVTKRRVASRKQVGVVKVNRLVRDPNGTIEREHKFPEYGPGGADVWERYALGDNALALFALRRAGVSADHPTVVQLTTNLDNFLNTYGYPDETWDLAWLTAAFSCLPKEQGGEKAAILASKLLDGQVREGEAAGLWGPVAINTKLLAEQVLKVGELTIEFQGTKKNASSESKQERRAFQEADSNYRTALRDLSRVATFGMVGQTIESVLTTSIEFGPTAQLAGLCDYIYNQRSADLGSTAVAIYALRQAADNGTLPKELWRPESSQVEAESPSSLLSKTVEALARKLVEKRDWDEMNHYQPVKDFAKVTIFPGLPGADVPFPKLASSTSLLTTAQGFSSMAGAARIVNSEQLFTKYRPHLGKGLELFRTSADSFLKKGSKLESKPRPMEPFEHYLFLSEVTREQGSSKEDRRDLWQPLAQHLLSLRSAKGNWENKGFGRRYHLPSSMLARLAVMEQPDTKALFEFEKPHVNRSFYALASIINGDRKIPPTVEDIVPTSCAMIFLAENVRPPIIGECVWTSGTQGSRLTPLVTSVMRQQAGLSVRYQAVSRPLKIELITELPSLLIRGESAFDPSDGEIAALQDYLKAGGLVLFEAMGNSDGSQFLKRAQGAVKSWLPATATLEEIGSDKELMGPVAGTASIQAFKKSNGSLAAAFLPLAPEAGSKGLPQVTAARAVYNMLLQKLPPEMLKEDFPVSIQLPAAAEPPRE